MSDLPNQAPADELHAVRAELIALEERERQLRQLMLSDPSARTGNRYCVEVREVTTNRLDIKALREMYPVEVEEHTYPTVTKRVELRGISDDGEIVSLRKGADK
jgi:hypothetical protein